MGSFGLFVSMKARNVPREQAMFRGAIDKDVFQELIEIIKNHTVFRQSLAKAKIYLTCQS